MHTQPLPDTPRISYTLELKAHLETSEDVDGYLLEKVQDSVQSLGFQKHTFILRKEVNGQFCWQMTEGFIGWYG
jgi:hypothetical protein